jgi:tRNA(Ile)-lysidine synthase
MPLLTKRWPSITSTINRSSEHCREGQLLLDELAADDLSVSLNDTKSLIVASLTLLSQKRFNNLIRYFLAQNKCLMPSTEQLAQLYLQLNADSDKNPVVKVGDNVIRRYKGILYLTADFTDISDWHTDIVFNDSKIEVLLPDNLGKLHLFKTTFEDATQGSQRIIIPKNGQKVTVRFNHNNPNCLPDYRNHSRSVKKILQELDIPVWQRKRIPFLYYDDVLVAAIGYFVCQNYVPKALTPNDTEFQEDKSNLTITWIS